jgi:hypothetical protein
LIGKIGVFTRNFATNYNELMTNMKKSGAICGPPEERDELVSLSFFVGNIRD